jgi:hypothetical protein
VRRVAFVDISDVLSEAKKQQVIALGRLGSPLRRIEQETGVRRETAGAYLKAAGIGVRPLGAWMLDYEVRQTMGRSVLPAYKLELMVAEQTSSAKTVSLAFQVIVTNISELLGENCSIVLYAPAEKIDVESFDNGGSTEINGERYLRLLGPAIFKVFPGRPEKVAISAKASCHELKRPVDPIQLAVKLFDSHGLALSQTYTLKLLPRPAQVELAFEEPLNREASISPP